MLWWGRGQHACAIATALGNPHHIRAPLCGILSAVGIGLAEVVEEAQEPAAAVLTPEALPGLEERLQVLEERAVGRCGGKALRRPGLRLPGF